MELLKIFGVLTFEELTFLPSQAGFYQAVQEEYKKLFPRSEIDICNNSKSSSDVKCADYSMEASTTTKKYLIKNSNYIRIEYSKYCQMNFIVSEIPLKNRQADFWSMVFKKSGIVVMLADAGCWSPSIGDYMIVDDFKITTINVVIKCQYLEATVLILNTTSGKVNQVFCYLYFQKLMFGVPKSELMYLEFLNVVRQKYEILRQHDFYYNYIIVHSDSDQGEINTFCAEISGMQSLKETGKVNLFNIVKDIVSCRPLSVFLLNQYMLCYKLLAYHVQQQYVNSILNKIK
uniref:Putative tyrosine phosphatase protein n=1 Tax=Toxoneuron nigriceps polydnavirus TaxID=191766 RepID=Q1H8S7_9VIRU|nr:putative tyrosine phosphatase protein [Toxoneuron nigriceps polydnavirus]